MTIKAPGRVAQIVTTLGVSAAFDPAVPPESRPNLTQTAALWDTGASWSVISTRLAQSLDLVATGVTQVTHAPGASSSLIHMVHFELPNGVGIPGVLVTEFPGSETFDAIVGMDVITLGDLAITNVEAKTWMSFRIPSVTAADFVEEHDRALFSGVGRNDPCPCGSGEKLKRCSCPLARQRQ